MTAMLNESDIDLMTDWQDEIYTLRARPVTFSYREKQNDPISGIEIGETEHRREAIAVVTEVSSNSDRNIAAGIIYEEGDIKVDVKIELVEDIADKITQMVYDGKEYEIVAKPKKGIGKRNRYELHGRLIA